MASPIVTGSFRTFAKSTELPALGTDTTTVRRFTLIGGLTRPTRRTFTRKPTTSSVTTTVTTVETTPSTQVTATNPTTSTTSTSATTTPTTPLRLSSTTTTLEPSTTTISTSTKSITTLEPTTATTTTSLETISTTAPTSTSSKSTTTATQITNRPVTNSTINTNSTKTERPVFISSADPSIDSTTQISKQSITTIAVILGVIAAILLIIVMVAIYFGIYRRRKLTLRQLRKAGLISSQGRDSPLTLNLQEVTNNNDHAPRPQDFGSISFNNMAYEKTALPAVPEEDYLSPTYQGFENITSNADYQHLEPKIRSLPMPHIPFISRSESNGDCSPGYQGMVKTALDSHVYTEKDDSTYYEDPEKVLKAHNRTSDSSEYHTIRSDSVHYSSNDGAYQLADETIYETAGSESTAPYQTVDDEAYYDRPADSVRGGSVLSRTPRPDSIYETIRET